MIKTSKFQLSLLYLAHSVAMSDGVSQRSEKHAIDQLRKLEDISDILYSKFKKELKKRSTHEIYEVGCDLLKQCKQNQQLIVVAWIYKIIEADGQFHIKEAQWLLKIMADLKFNLDRVIEKAKQLPDLYTDIHV